jgi:hypothetical protein
MAFATNSLERMRLDTSGNLGLGVTPSAWNSGYKALVVGGTNGNNQVGGIASGSGITIVSTNYYRSSTPDEIYAGTGYAMKYLQSSGQHQWHNAPSGTAGDAISFTQAMTLNASGNLGIGTTSPTSYGAGTTTLSVGNATGSGYIDIYNAGSRRGYQYATASTFNISTTTGTALVFETQGAEVGRFDTSGNLLLKATSAGTSAAGVLGMGNATAPSSSPAGMGQLYVEGGALKFRGSSGTVTTIAPA